MKKIISFTVALFIFAVALPFISADAESSIEDKIMLALQNHKETLDIGSYNLDVDEAADVYFDFLLNTPDLFYADATIDFEMKSDNTTVKEYVFIYLLDENETLAAVEFYNNKLQEILSYMPNGLDDFGKALWIHDYICANFDYDDDYLIYDPYNMLVNNKGVCQAYTLLYDALLERVGINSRSVDGEDINHIWNEVEIDGQWYYVDTTWDDPGLCVYGEVYYDYFLLSEEAFASDGEHGSTYESEYKCESDKYDNCTWHSSASPFGFVGGNTYFTYGLDIYYYDNLTGEEKIIFTIDEEFFATDYAEFYNEYFMGFGSYGEKLLFGVSDGIFSLDPTTLETNVIFAMNEGDGGIVSFHNVANVGYYAICASDDEEYENITYGSFKISPDSNIDYTLGDINGDGNISASDYALLKRAYFGLYSLSDIQKLASDIDCNGIINVRDYALLKRHCLGSYVITEN